MNGLKRIISIPPAKFESEPCNDKPTAKPIAPKIATNDEVGTPRFEITVTNNKIRKAHSNMSARNLDKVGSKFLLIIMFLMILFVNLMAYKPINKIKKAEINFGE
ncbi:hypothetical protein D3C84_1074550 [compost metagenome]